MKKGTAKKRRREKKPKQRKRKKIMSREKSEREMRKWTSVIRVRRTPPSGKGIKREK
jgi:hypothetical protein